MAVHEHKAKAPKKVTFLVVTISDTRSEETDRSGARIKELVGEAGYAVGGYRIVRDEPEQIETLLREALARTELDIVVLNGGTGISPRDGTYEAVSRVLEKKLDGFGEIFRYLSYLDIGSSAIMSRAVAGIAQGKVIISLPGSTGAVELAMRKLVIPEVGHMVAQAGGG